MPSACWRAGLGGGPGAIRKAFSAAPSEPGGRILMPGELPFADVQQCWADFDCAIHVPVSENCGGVVEPLLAGVPTIAGDVGGLPEVVMHGVTGIMVPIR